MPLGNAFRHQVYSSDPPEAPYRLLRPKLPPSFESDEGQQRMRCVGQALRDAHVSAIYLVHGTFTGNDVLGVLRELEWFAPQWSQPLRHKHKLVVDKLAGQVGNYTSGFAQLFESLINSPSEPPIPVRLFNWSSENNHLGRADAAVQLLCELMDRCGSDRRRFLLWGHSHAGNVFALLTNVLGSNPASRRRFFRAGRPYYGWTQRGRQKAPAWTRLRKLLDDDPNVSQRLELDFVTFGTPIRYGWETQGYHRLLHFVHHRPVPDLAEYRTAFPFSLQDLLEARSGDYAQQLGIAGTNFPTNLLSWRNALAERQLNKLLQRGIHWRDTLEHLQQGQRTAEEGQTLLVDYPPDEDELNKQLFGHAIYTRPEWLLMHAEQMVRRVYGSQGRKR